MNNLNAQHTQIGSLLTILPMGYLGFHHRHGPPGLEEMEGGRGDSLHIVHVH